MLKSSESLTFQVPGGRSWRSSHWYCSGGSWSRWFEWDWQCVSTWKQFGLVWAAQALRKAPSIWTRRSDLTGPEENNPGQNTHTKSRWNEWLLLLFQSHSPKLSRSHIEAFQLDCNIRSTTLCAYDAICFVNKMLTLFGLNLYYKLTLRRFTCISWASWQKRCTYRDFATWRMFWMCLTPGFCSCRLMFNSWVERVFQKDISRSGPQLSLMFTMSCAFSSSLIWSVQWIITTKTCRTCEWRTQEIKVGTNNIEKTHNK